MKRNRWQPNPDRLARRKRDEIVANWNRKEAA